MVTPPVPVRPKADLTPVLAGRHLVGSTPTVVAAHAVVEAQPVPLVRGKAPMEAPQATTVALRTAREEARVEARAAGEAGPVTPVGAKGVQVGPAATAAGKGDVEGMLEVTEAVAVTRADRAVAVEVEVAVAVDTGGEPQPAE